MRHDFTSILGPEMEDFLRFKRAMGHPYESGEQTLRSLDRFIAANALSGGDPTLGPLVFRWLANRGGRKVVRHRPVAPDCFVFLDARGLPLSRDGVAHILAKHAALAAARHPHLARGCP